MRIEECLKVNGGKVRKISKEEQVIALVTTLRQYSSEREPLKQPIYLDGYVCRGFFGDKTTRSKLIKYVAWVYDTDWNGYLMEPKYWRIVYDELKEEYERRVIEREWLYFPTPESFGKGHRITNLYYNRNAEEYGITYM